MRAECCRLRSSVVCHGRIHGANGGGRTGLRCAAGSVGRSALRWAVGAVARLRRFRPEKFYKWRYANHARSPARHATTGRARGEVTIYSRTPISRRALPHCPLVRLEHQHLQRQPSLCSVSHRSLTIDPRPPSSLIALPPGSHCPLPDRIAQPSGPGSPGDRSLTGH